MWLAIVANPDLSSELGADAALDDAPIGGGGELFADTMAHWVRDALEPFRPSGLDAPRAPEEELDVRTTVLGEAVTFTVHLGADLLEEMVAAYAAYGWDAVEAIGARVGLRGRGREDGARQFIAATKQAAASVVVAGLVSLEEMATRFARDRWGQARKVLEGYLRQFRLGGTNPPTHEFADTALEKRVIALCHEYAVALDEAARLEPEVRRRRQGDFEVVGSGQHGYFEIYAAPQRVALATMDKVLTQIVEVFPAAALVLDDLPPEIHRGPGGPGWWNARKTLPKLIHARVRDLLDEVNGLLRTLDHGRPATLVLTGRTWGRIVQRLPTSGGGVERQLALYATKRTAAEQRVMANPHLLRDLDDLELEDNPVPAVSWERIVLRQYRARLAQEIDAQRAADRAAEIFWRTLAWLAALLAIVAFLALFPEAVTMAPALATAAAFAGKAAVVLGLVVFVVHDVVGSLVRATEIEADARDRLYVLGQQDPEQLRALGSLLAESAMIRRRLGEGLLMLLLQVGLSKFTVIARALDLQGFLDDVRTLFSPLERTA